jgi:hypothetical protein
MSARDSPPATLRGRWLLLACVVWVVVALLYVGVFISGIPSEFARLQTPCTDAVSCNLIPHLTMQKVQELKDLGLSAEFFAAYFVAIEVAFTALSAAIGALIFWRKPEDRMALLVSLMLLTFGGALPIPLFTLDLSPLWTASARAVSFVGAALAILFFYVFPDGHFVPRWSRWLVLASIGVLAPTLLLPYSFLSLWRHPLLNALLSASIVGALLSAQAYRYKRVSTLAQRQQTKWVVFGTVAAFGGYGTFTALDLLLQSALLASLLSNTAFFVLMLLIPISIAVAVLRYRLYDIDILINRTLVYGALTVLLALVYFGGVAATEAIFRALTGQEEQPQLAIVVSTLVIAALFNPLRRRIQGFIDRRFYRRKYDARKTLEAFSAKLRDETDLDALSEDLVGVVRETMQPEHISLWLRPDPEPRDKKYRAAIREARHDE